MAVLAVSADDRLRALLEAAGARYSGARKQVAARLRAARRPLSAEDLRRSEPSVPYSSIYRALAVLARAGAARRLVGADGIARFELAEAVSGEHHHHLVCTDCGGMDVVLLPAAAEDELARAAQAMQRTGRFVVHSSRVELTGRCAGCAAQQTGDPGNGSTLIRNGPIHLNPDAGAGSPAAGHGRVVSSGAGG